MVSAAPKRVWSFVLAALLVSSCTKLLGLDYDYRGAGGGGGQATSSSSTTSVSGGAGGSLPECGAFVWDPQDTCRSCMAGSCCDELKACDTGTPCEIITTCAKKCAPMATECKLDCLWADDTDHAGQGLSDYLALTDCNTQKCRDPGECLFPVCDSGFTTGDRACSDCLANDTVCCGKLSACSDDPSCVACLNDGTSAVCAAHELFKDVVKCQNVTCGTLCAYSICDSPLFGYWQATCNYCLSKGTGGCCNQFANCTESPSSTCYKCLTGEVTAGCDDDSTYQAFITCSNNKCGVACSGI